MSLRLHPAELAAGRELVARALAEDGAERDLTSRVLIPDGVTAQASIVVKAPGVLAGLELARETFRQAGIEDFAELVHDGAQITDLPCVVARVAGQAGALLSAERTALNLLQRLSGVATATRRCVELVQGTKCRVYDTRKTTPGLRQLEKYAVRAGGGCNHRLGLWDAVLIKDNHVALAGGVGPAWRKARSQVGPEIAVQVEVRTLAELEEALAAGANLILLDNMTVSQLREAVRLGAGRAELEASGNISLQNLAEVAGTGVDRVSLGWITHSAPALDISLDVSLDN